MNDYTARCSAAGSAETAGVGSGGGIVETELNHTLCAYARNADVRAALNSLVTI